VRRSFASCPEHNAFAGIARRYLRAMRLESKHEARFDQHSRCVAVARISGKVHDGNSCAALVACC
jgi:hypothetical protein